VQAVAAALSVSRSPQALDLLRTIWNDPSPEIRAARPAILRALKDRGAPDLDEYLTAALASSDAALRSAALGREGSGADVDADETQREPKDYQRIARTLGHRVRLETSAGILEIALDYRNASLTAENFVELVAAGRLDGQRFLAVTPGRDLTFEASADEATAGPERVWRPELNGQPFLRGSLGLDAAKGDSAGNRFFVCLTPQPLAGGRYTNFGRLVSGDDLLDAITVERRILKATLVE
jgi:cyclophilin family peptidyl-prolyl cis-trans isomerase